MTSRIGARNRALLCMVMTGMFGGFTSPTIAAVVGSTADLTTHFHLVSGTVTVVDADTFRVDDFTYDGGGPAVYFYLGTEQTSAAFESGLPIFPLLTGTTYDGSQGSLFYDLPGGETFDNYHAISVWCADFKIDFGSGTFVAPPLQGDLNTDGYVGLDDLDIILNHWNQNVPTGDPLQGDVSGVGGTPDGYVGLDDLDVVLNNWNAGTPPAQASTIPEPASAVILLASAGVILPRRRN